MCCLRYRKQTPPPKKKEKPSEVSYQLHSFCPETISLASKNLKPTSYRVFEYFFKKGYTLSRTSFQAWLIVVCLVNHSEDIVSLAVLRWQCGMLFVLNHVNDVSLKFLVDNLYLSFTGTSLIKADQWWHIGSIVDCG